MSRRLVLDILTWFILGLCKINLYYLLNLLTMQDEHARKYQTFVSIRTWLSQFFFYTRL